MGDRHRREQLARRHAAAKWASLIHAKAELSSSVRVGRGVVVMAGAVVNSGAVLGEHCIVNTGAIVEHDVTIGARVQVAPGVAIGGGAVISDGAQLGLEPGFAITSRLVRMRSLAWAPLSSAMLRPAKP